MQLANRYKLISKPLFSLQLLAGFAIVFVGTAKRDFGRLLVIPSPAPRSG